MSVLAIALWCAITVRSEPLSLDAGAVGAWQKIRKLQTTASVMHTTAHPDDEHGGLLAMLSRGQGARVALLTLTRGESGDNAIGPELFDGLGLIRTEELAVAGRFYGLDRQYFTSVADYGYSKRLDEALQKWGKDYVLGEVVRVIRIDRPLVLASAILSVAQWMPSGPRIAGTTGFTCHDMLERRVRRLAGEDIHVRTHVTWRSLAGAAAALVLLWTSGVIVAHPLHGQTTHAAVADGPHAGDCEHHEGLAILHLFCDGLAVGSAPAPCPHARS